MENGMLLQQILITVRSILLEEIIRKMDSGLQV